MSEWRLADVEQATAYWSDGFHVVRIRGMMPTPCHEVRLSLSLLTVEPPGVLAHWRERDRICQKVLTPYDYRRAFDLGERRSELTLSYADGELTVPVEDAGASSSRAVAVPGTVVSNLHDPLTGGELPPAEAVGYSTAWDLKEALDDAIATLPRPVDPPADHLARYEVMATGVEIGGIAGFNHLWVRVRGG